MPGSRPLAILLLTALLLLGAPLQAARWLDQAARLIDKGEFRKAIGLLQKRQRQPGGRASFLLAYAHFKLGEHETAERLLATLSDDTAEVVLLRGMLAVARGDLQGAPLLLDKVIARGEEPWSSAAVRLLETVKETRARRHADLVLEARALLDTGKLDLAERRRDQAEQLLADQVEVRYYRGYLAYQRKQYQAARSFFEESLRLRADDEWSRFMLSLTRAETGDPVGARVMLGELAGQARIAGVRSAARKALLAMQPPAPPPPTVVAPQPAAPAPSRLLLGLEAGSGFDSNPAYLIEADAPLADAGWVLQGQARLLLRWPLLQDRLQPRLELRGFERAYGVGGNQSAQTNLAATAALALVWQRFSLEVTSAYAFFMYGHAPVLSTYGGSLTLWGRLRSWLWLGLEAGLQRRSSHDRVFAYLESLQLTGSPSLRFSARRGALELGYQLGRDWADPIKESSQTISRRGKGPGSPSETTTYLISSNYSQLGHGPALAGQLQLPWRLRLSAAAGLEWRRYDQADSLWSSETGLTETYPLRRDLRLSLEAELARQLPRGLELALRFESLDNWSSLDAPADTGINRSYSRRLAGLHLRWSWPVEP